MEAVQERIELPTYRPFVDALGACQGELLALETDIFTPIEADLTQLTLRAQVELNAKLRAQEYFQVHEEEVLDCLVTAIGNLSGAVIQSAPSAHSSPLTVPLICAIPDPNGFVEGIIEIFRNEEYPKHNVFVALTQVLYENLCTASGIPPEGKSTKPLVWPRAAEMSPLELVDTYLAGTPLHALLLSPYPFALPDEQRFAGYWVIAPQGMGKTTLLHDLIIEDIKKDASIILMDSKGDLIEPYLGLNAISHRRVIIGPDNPIGINPLDIPRSDINKAVDNLEYLFASLLDFKLTAAQSMLLKAVLRSLVTAFPKPTLGTFQDIMSDGPKKYAEYIRNLEPDLQNFFKNEFFSENIKARRQEVLHRLRLLLDNDLLCSMLMASSSTFDLGAAMDQGAFIIINNSRGRLGNKGAEFFGRFFIAQVLAAAQQRSFRRDRDKKPVYFYIDECHTVVAQDERVTDVLHECRSQKIGLILAHQETTQVSENVLSALQNCAVRFAHPDEEARKLAGTLRMGAKALQSMHRGQFAAYVRGLSKEGFVVNVDRPDFSSVKAPQHPHNQRPTIHVPTKEEPVVNFNPRPPGMEPWRLDSADKPAAAARRDLHEKIRQRFNEVPKLVQEVIQSSETEKHLRALAAANKLNAEQYEPLENEVLLALLDFQPTERLGHNIKIVLGVSDELADRLAADIGKFIFDPLRQALDRSVTGGESTPAASTTVVENAPPDDPGEPSSKW
jgi:hypothetical protein